MPNPLLPLLVFVGARVAADIASWEGDELYADIVEDREIAVRQGIVGTPDGYDVADEPYVVETVTETGEPTWPRYDAANVTSDAAILRARFEAFGQAQAEVIAGRSRFGAAYETRGEARAAARRGQYVVELHGLALYFLAPPSA